MAETVKEPTQPEEETATATEKEKKLKSLNDLLSDQTSDVEFDWDNFSELGWTQFVAYSKPASHILKKIEEDSPEIVGLITSGQTEEKIEIDLNAYNNELSDADRHVLNEQGFDTEYFESGKVYNAVQKQELESLEAVLPLLLKTIPSLFTECNEDLMTLAVMQTLPNDLVGKAVKTGQLKKLISEAQEDIEDQPVKEILALAVASILDIIKTAKAVAGGERGKFLTIVQGAGK